MTAAGPVWIHRDALHMLLSLRARPWEIGGWVLGYRTETMTCVTHVTPPRSVGTPFGVTISGRGHREFFDRIWATTGGAVTYLGDWHTHPGGPAFPSATDERAAAQIAADPDFAAAHPLVLIVATGRFRGPVSDVRCFERGTDRLGEREAIPFDYLPPWAEVA